MNSRQGLPAEVRVYGVPVDGRCWILVRWSTLVQVLVALRNSFTVRLLSSGGIMYIIYRQRIWDVRMASSGWVPMEDRGSITANHYDHVHISVF